MEPQLGRRRGFACPLQTSHQHHRGRLIGLRERGIAAPHHVDQLLMHHLNELLVGRYTTNNLSTNCFLADFGHKILDHRQTHVRIEKRPPDLLKRPLHIRFGDCVLASQPFDGIFKTG